MNLEWCAATALSSLPATARERFADNPYQALSSMGLTIEAVDELVDTRPAGGACDGTSILQDGVILYTPSPRSRRENFTLGHELGHYLVDRDEQIMNWLADQPEPMLQLETICDRIAQALLLPGDTVRTLTSSGPIRADTVLDLYQRTQASRPACAIAVATRLPGLGAVAILDLDANEVSFTSVHPDPDRGWPEVFPWKGHAVPAGHPLKTLAPGGRLTRGSYWETPWGRREPFYIDAVHDGRRILAVFSDTDLWACEKLHIEPRREYLHRPDREVTCCGSTRQVRGYPCPTCDGGYCPSCGRCRCQKSADREQTCQGCYLTYQRHLLVNGRCEDCR